MHISRYAVPTAGQFVFAADFDGKAGSDQWPGRAQAINFLPEAGDGIVPLRSSLRGMNEWPGNLDGTNLYYKGYFNQVRGVVVCVRM
jgi:hypothetical protein